ncbi:MAG: rod shape-determining protein MreC [Monoglobales bacterium]
MINELLKKKFFTVLIIVVIIVGIIAGVGKLLPESKRANIFSDAVGIVISPFQGSFSWAVGNIKDSAQYFIDNKKTSQENKRLKDKITVLENKLEKVDAYREENLRLKEILELSKQNAQHNPVCAEVIGREAENWSGIIKLNKGSLSGIEKNDIVVETAGLVGYVSEVGTNWCAVTTVVSPDSGISCIVPRTAEIVMLQGGLVEKSSNGFTLSYIPENSTITQGEAIETSGEGGIYPKGLLVGRVENIHIGADGVSKEADGKAAVDFKKLREVLVLKY